MCIEKLESGLMDKFFSSLDTGRDIIPSIFDSAELFLKSNFGCESCRKKISSSVIALNPID